MKNIIIFVWNLVPENKQNTSLHPLASVDKPQRDITQMSN